MKRNNKPIFGSVAAFFVLLVSTLLAQTATTLQTRDEVISEVRLMAERHAEGQQSMDTSTVLSVYEPYTPLVTRQEMAQIYEIAFLEAKGRLVPKAWDVFRPTVGWIVALIFFVFAVFKAQLESVGNSVARKIFEFVRKQFTASRYITNVNLRRYCSGLVSQHSKLRVPFSRRELVLNDIFVPLRVADAKRGVGDIDAYDAIRKYRKLVITGNPGAGKTVLLSHLALSFARCGRSDLGRDVVPILFPLHRVRDAATEKSMKNHLIEEMTRCGMPNAEGFLQSALQNGTVMLLFDGLDEVNRDRRPLLAQAIKDLLAAYPNCRVVITCRTAVYEDEFFGEVDEHLMISDFLDHQIIAFLQPWQKLMPSGQSVEHLIETLRDRPRIMAMARNPLQLTMICSLYSEEHEQFTLPHSRTEFYERSTQLFLDRWHKERNRYSTPHKAAVLEHLGLFLHVTGGTSMIDADKRSAPLETVLAEVNRVLPRLNLSPATDTQAILDEIVERSGLLMRLDSGERFQFAHLTIQEYYAAQGLSTAPQELLNHYQKDPQHWREVLRLWCGLDHDCSNFVRQLFRMDPVIALECVADAQRIDDDVASMVTTYFHENLKEQIVSSANVREAYAAVASNPRPRGREMLDFLGAELEVVTDDSLRQAIAETLAATNLPTAATILFGARQRCVSLTPALISMGDLAVLALRPLVDEGNLTAVDDLFKVGTPNAAMALVPRLWDSSGAVRDLAAWALASLLTKREVERALATYPLNAQMSSLPQYAWVWAPFAEVNMPALPIIMGKVAAFLAASSEVPIFILGSQMEPRIASAVVFLIRIGETIAMTEATADWKPSTQMRLRTILGIGPDKELVPEVARALRGGSHKQNIQAIWETFLANAPETSTVPCLLRGLPAYLLNELTSRCFDSESRDLTGEWKTMRLPPPKRWWSWVTAPAGVVVLMGILVPILFDVTPLLLSRTIAWWEDVGVIAVVVVLVLGCGAWLLPVLAYDRVFEENDFLRSRRLLPSITGAAIFLFGPFFAIFSFLIGIVVTMTSDEGGIGSQLVALCCTIFCAPVLFAATLAWFQVGGLTWWGWGAVYVAVMAALFALGSWKSSLDAKIRNPLRGIIFERPFPEAHA